MEHFSIKYMPFPDMLHDEIKGMTAHPDGKEYIILIDSKLNTADRLHTLKHELSHILLGHHDQEARPLEEIEKEADAHAAAVTEDELAKLMAYERR